MLIEITLSNIGSKVINRYCFDNISWKARKFKITDQLFVKEIKQIIPAWILRLSSPMTYDQQ